MHKWKVTGGELGEMEIEAYSAWDAVDKYRAAHNEIKEVRPPTSVQVVLEGRRALTIWWEKTRK